MMVCKNHCGMGGQWCMKTTKGQVGDGVQKPPLGGFPMVCKNHHGVDAQWCMKTTIGQVCAGVWWCLDTVSVAWRSDTASR